MDSSYGVVFGDACDNHDSCFAAKGANKSQCDYAFRRDIQRDFFDQCPPGLPGFGCTVHGGYIANVYFLAVHLSATGEQAFRDAQGLPPIPRINPWEAVYDRWADYP